MGALIDRHRAGRPIYGLSPSFAGPRWTIIDGGAQELGLAHGPPRPSPEPLVVVGVIQPWFDERSWVDIHHTLGTTLMLGERSRNDWAFQVATRDQSAIDRELAAVPAREAWCAARIVVDGTPQGFELLARNGDWVAVHDLGDEWLYVHSQQSGTEPVALETISDIGPYVEGDRLLASGATRFASSP